MASIIRIKRSSVSGNPATLAAGELAYSALTDNGSNGGDRLYIGIGSETAGNAANHFVIGGKYFTDKLDHTPGVLTASSALIVDADKKLDELLVDSLSLNDNTLSSTGTLKLQAGTGNIIELASNNYISGGAFGGSQLILDNSAAAVKQLRGGSVSLTVGAEGTATSSLVLNNDGSLTVPGTIKTLSNGDLTLAPNGTGKLVLNNTYIGDTSTTLAEYIFDQVGGATTAGTGITITNNDGANTSTISLANTTVTAGSYGSATAIPTFTVDAQGRLTAAGTANISTTLSIAGDTGTDSVALGTDTITFVGGTGLTSTVAAVGAATSVTFDIDSTVVTLDGTQTLTNKTISGASNTLSNIGNSSLTNSSVTIGSTSVALGATVTTFTGLSSVTSTSFVGALTGNASTATKLATARTISLSGDVSGSVSFDGSGNADITATIQANSVALGTDTTGDYIATIAGTTNQISVSGSGGETAAVTLSLPQNIHSGATPTFAGMSLSAALAMGSNKITGLADPTDAQDAATKAYVDAARAGLDVKQSVRAATTVNVSLSGTQTVDGVALSIGDRILVKNQTDATQNGIYVVASGSWARSADADAPNEVSPGLFLFVEEGTLNADNGYVITSDAPLTVGTDPIVFTQFSGAGMIVAGAALTKTGNTLDVQVAANGGIEIASDALQLKSSLAGDGLAYSSGVLSLASSSAGAGLAYTTGVLSVNVQNGIEITSDALQLASSVAGAGLTYSSGVLAIGGTADRITVSTDSIDIASTYVGQNSITTLGTITTGVWNGTAIGTGYGGTGLTSYTTGDLIYASATNTLSKRAAGTDGQILQMNSSGVPVWGDIDGGTY